MTSARDHLTSWAMLAFKITKKCNKTLNLSPRKWLKDQPWRLKPKKRLELHTQSLVEVMKDWLTEEHPLSLSMLEIWSRIWSNKRPPRTALDATPCKKSRMFLLELPSKTVRQLHKQEPSLRMWAAAPRSTLSLRLAKRRSSATRRRPAACWSDQTTFRSTHLGQTMAPHQSASGAMVRRSTKRDSHARNATELEGSEINSSKISKRF